MQFSNSCTLFSPSESRELCWNGSDGDSLLAGQIF